MVKHVGRRKEMPPPDKEHPPVDDRAADLEIIEQLLQLALEAITHKTPEAKLADVLKLLEFKHQLKPQVDARRVFWEWIDRFRREASEGGVSVANLKPDQKNRRSNMIKERDPAESLRSADGGPALKTAGAT